MHHLSFSIGRIHQESMCWLKPPAYSYTSWAGYISLNMMMRGRGTKKKLLLKEFLRNFQGSKFLLHTIKTFLLHTKNNCPLVKKVILAFNFYFQRHAYEILEFVVVFPTTCNDYCVFSLGLPICLFQPLSALILCHKYKFRYLWVSIHNKWNH